KVAEPSIRGREGERPHTAGRLITTLPDDLGTGPATPADRPAAAPVPGDALDATEPGVDDNAPAPALPPHAHPAEPLTTAGPLAAGLTAWWLRDETVQRTLTAELEAERRRTRFLAEASSALLASLNLERCMEVTARLAAEHLADAAVVIAQTGARRLPVVVR